MFELFFLQSISWLLLLLLVSSAMDCLFCFVRKAATSSANVLCCIISFGYVVEVD